VSWTSKNSFAGPLNPRRMSSRVIATGRTSLSAFIGRRRVDRGNRAPPTEASSAMSPPSIRVSSLSISLARCRAIGRTVLRVETRLD
jgi:hypothetical protein